MRDEETGTYWQQISGAAISGPLQGRQLALVHSDELTLATWKGIHVYALTTNADDLKKKFAEAKWNFPVFNIDYTVFRTAARTNPCIYLIKNGTIVDKWPLKRKDAALHYIEKLKP